MKNLLFINQEQFGYHTDTYYYCKYLTPFFKITYICWDHNLPKVELKRVNIIYVPRKRNAVLKNMAFLRTVLTYLNSRTSQHTIVFICYFKLLSSLLRLLKPNQKIILDIRTASVKTHKRTRFFYDLLLKLEVKLFKNVTIISTCLAKKLHIYHKAHLLPLGAQISSIPAKSFNDLHLLYIGTFINRRIEDTIIGFHQFHEQYHQKVKMTYTIIGSGKDDEEAVLKKLVHDYGLQGIVRILGRIQHSKLSTYLEKATIGISFIPLTDYFDCQPPTKTYEYLFSGMPVIATRTFEHRKMIHKKNGVLIKDTSADFCRGIENIYMKLNTYNSHRIKLEHVNFTWEKIVLHNLKIYLDSQFQD